MEERKFQLNASLRYSPTGELLSRDLLLNFYGSSVENCASLLAEFRRKFNLPLGLQEAQATQPKPKEPIAILQAKAPSNCPRCSASLIERQSKRDGRKFWGCMNFARKGCTYSFWA